MCADSRGTSPDRRTTNSPIAVAVNLSAAQFEAGAQDTGAQIQTRRLQDVVDDKVSFVKIDTDGYDGSVVAEVIGRQSPCG